MFKILTIPFNSDTDSFNDEILSDFLLNKKIRDRQVEFFLAEGKPYWTVFLEYDIVLEKTVSSETSGLDEAQKMLLERLKSWRKEKADTSGVPVYIVATNSELRDIVKLVPQSLEALNTVKGYGRKKIERYGKDILKLLQAFYEKS